jgi:hypothetical protein
MMAKINALKGQLKLNPTLSTIAEDKKKGNKGENKCKKKNTMDSSNKNIKRKTRRGRKCHPRTAKRRQKKWANSPLTGANTTCWGQSTSRPIALWAKSTKKTRRKARKTEPTLLLLHPQPPPPTIAMRLYWPFLQP